MKYYYLSELIQLIRAYFHQHNFHEIIVPPCVENPGIEPHIHPFQLYSVKNKEKHPHFLHSSPEFFLKKVLSLNNEPFEKIYSLGYVFRDEPKSPIHRHQFMMLEWYEKFQKIEALQNRVIDIVNFIQKNHSVAKKKSPPVFTIKSMNEMFKDFLEINILDFLNAESLRELIEKKFPDVPLPKVTLSWDDYFFLLFLNKIEPHLHKFPFLIINKFPAPLSALAEVDEADPRVCKRFEFYINGIEVANCYQELCDSKELLSRYQVFKDEKLKNYHYELPYPNDFFQTMKNGLPPSSGIALGLERLFQQLIGINDPFMMD